MFYPMKRNKRNGSNRMDSPIVNDTFTDCIKLPPNCII